MRSARWLPPPFGRQSLPDSPRQSRKPHPHPRPGFRNSDNVPVCLIFRIVRHPGLAGRGPDAPLVTDAPQPSSRAEPMSGCDTLAHSLQASVINPQASRLRARVTRFPFPYAPPAARVTPASPEGPGSGPANDHDGASLSLQPQRWSIVVIGRSPGGACLAGCG